MSEDSSLSLAFAKNANDEIFINKIQRAMLRAIDLILAERRHHAFCVRSPTMIVKYKEDFQLAWADSFADLPQDQQSVLRSWLENIEILKIAACSDIDQEYESAKRRSVILLADLLESYVETLVSLCLVHSLKTPDAIKLLSKQKATTMIDLNNPRDIRESVRRWERNGFPDLKDSRADRFLGMIQRFMPLEFYQVTEINNLIAHRNAFTHEIIQIGDIDSSTYSSANAALLSLDEVDSFFDAVSEFITATMKAFKQYRPLQQ